MSSRPVFSDDHEYGLVRFCRACLCCVRRSFVQLWLPAWLLADGSCGCAVFDLVHRLCVRNGLFLKAAFDRRATLHSQCFHYSDVERAVAAACAAIGWVVMQPVATMSCGTALDQTWWGHGSCGTLEYNENPLVISMHSMNAIAVWGEFMLGGAGTKVTALVR